MNQKGNILKMQTLKTQAPTDLELFTEYIKSENLASVADTYNYHKSSIYRRLAKFKAKYKVKTTVELAFLLHRAEKINLYDIYLLLENDNQIKERFKKCV